MRELYLSSYRQSCAGIARLSVGALQKIFKYLHASKSPHPNGPCAQCTLPCNEFLPSLHNKIIRHGSFDARSIAR